MKRTKWNTSYPIGSRQFLQCLVSLEKNRSYIEALYLPSHATDSVATIILSSKEHERKIATILSLVDTVLDRCEETAQRTNYRLLQWLRSHDLHSCYSKPFQLLGRATSRRRYRRTLKQFLAFTLRAFYLPVALRQTWTRIQFDKKQARTINAVWNHEAWAFIQPPSLVNLSIICFCDDAQAFFRPSRCTTHLSTLIYNARIVLLEYALPRRSYPSLNVTPSAPAQRLKRLNQVRERFMVTGSGSTLEELQSLFGLGRLLARHDPPTIFLRWSDDGEAVSFGDEFKLSMQAFRSLTEYFIS